MRRKSESFSMGAAGKVRNVRRILGRLNQLLRKREKRKGGEEYRTRQGGMCKELRGEKKKRETKGSMKGGWRGLERFRTTKREKER